MSLVPTVTSMRNWLTYLKRAALAAEPAGPLNGAIMKLFTNNFFPAPDSVAADFTLATFTGYASSTAIVWNDSIPDGADGADLTAPAKTFTATDGVIQENIWGYLITTAAGILIYAERFSEAKPINAEGDSVVVVPRLNLGQPLT